MHLLFLVLFVFSSTFAVKPKPMKPSIEFQLPIDCKLDEDCWVVNNVDFDSGEGTKDYKCNDKSYNGHKGVDFAIRDIKTMQDGVAILAAAKGTVKAMRDGVIDTSVRDADIKKIKGIECGNGVVIDHGDGWETQYCHLKKNSVKVRVGQVVTAGDKIGEVGLSGMTEYPHLHLSVRHNGKPVDPSYGEQEECGKVPIPMWAGKLKFYQFYKTGNVYNFGFSLEKPDQTKVREGMYRETSATKDAPMLIGWADIFNVEPGDNINIKILDPNNNEFATHSVDIKKYQARYFVFAGKKRPINGGWQDGKYRLEIAYMSKRMNKVAIKTADMRVTTQDPSS